MFEVGELLILMALALLGFHNPKKSGGDDGSQITISSIVVSRDPEANGQFSIARKCENEQKAILRGRPRLSRRAQNRNGAGVGRYL